MTHTPHELHEEFPEHAAKIGMLKTTDSHFAKLAQHYHEVNRSIHRAETDVEPMDDATIENLRKQRLRLKDEISAILAK